jgi:two-component system, sporulation sensor kinase D
MIEEIITTIHKPDTITLKKELIDVVILIDEIKMKRVFDNILKNAIESLTKNGVITIKNRVENEHVFITISDTGSGMSLEQKKNLYKPFFTSKENGTGLGLISCKKIVEAHGGIIEFESTENKGTTFTITLPQNIPNY